MKSTLLCCLICLTCSGYAQWNDDPSVNTPVNMDPATHQILPKTFVDDDNYTFIACPNVALDNSVSRLKVQRLSPAGENMWGPTGILVCVNTVNQSSQQMISDGQGGIIIVWIDQRRGTGVIDHFAQRFNAAGERLWGDEGIAVCEESLLYLYTYYFISDQKGGGFVIWDDSRGGGTSAVFAQRISPDGDLLWDPAGIQVSPRPLPYSSFSAVGDSTGGLLISWCRVTGVSSGNDVFAQRVTPNGELLWGPSGKLIGDGLKDQIGVWAVTDGRTGAFIMWQDFRNDPDFSQLRLQRIDSSGNTKWPLSGLLLRDSLEPIMHVLRVSSDSRYGLLYSWLGQYRDSGWGKQGLIYAQRVDTLGNITGDTSAIANPHATQMPIDINIGQDDLGGAYVSWIHYRNVSGAPEQVSASVQLRTQHFKADGSPEFDLGGKVLTTAPSLPVYLSGAASSKGLAVWAFGDPRNATDYNLFAVRIASPVPLPVTWIDFSVAVINDGHLLNWSTASEKDNSHFSIERKEGNTFREIGTVNAAGTSDAAQHYTWIDKLPLNGMNYYRIRQVDTDGKSSYSKIVAVNSLHGSLFAIYPNPASDRIYVQSPVANAQLTIFDMSGHKIKWLNTASGIQSVPLYDLPKGIYIVQVMSRREVLYTSKIVKQ